MKTNFATAMRRAMLSTRAMNLGDATRAIQEALGRRNTSGASPPGPQAPAGQTDAVRPRLVDANFDAQPAAASAGDREAPSVAAAFEDADRSNVHRKPVPSARVRRPLRDVLAALKAGGRPVPLSSLNLSGLNLPGMKGLNLSGLGNSNPPPLVEGAEFVTRSFAGPSGARDYKLYVPASARSAARGLVVMLHGCKQNPDDFARGTRMNTVAEAHGMLVAYPAQPASANVQSCWNWFNPADQQRDAGEPAIIAGITREIMSEYGLDRDRVFVAGLSAGGAMAAIMAESHPDIYAAAGIHSGLAFGAASDVVTAFAAMRGDSGDGGARARSHRPVAARNVRMIVFHGSADAVVHPSNGNQVFTLAQPNRAGVEARQERITTGVGRHVTRRVVVDGQGNPLVEYWLVDGAGHAWSGGDPSGSFTDAQGPDASAEMMRFFLAKPARH